MRLRRMLPGALIVIAFCSAPVAHADTLTVTSGTDGAAGSLRTLIAGASGGDTIKVPDPRALATPAARYVLTGGGLVVDKQLTIEGARARLVVIDGNQQDRVLDVKAPAAPLTLSGVTVTGGKVTAGAVGAGGGILIESGASLTLSDSAVVDNAVDVPAQAGFGGGIAGQGSLSLTRVLVADNTVTSNSASDSGFGGGIWVPAFASAFLTDSTVTGNTIQSTTAIDVLGGGLGASTNGFTSVGFSTVARNTASSGGNLAATGISAMTLVGVVIDAGSASDGVTGNCSGTVLELADNVFGQTGGCAVGTGFNSTVADPRLDTQLRDNGGPTDTLRPLPGSAAIDRFRPMSCPTALSDQRGVPRPVGSGCDSGAYEVSPPVPSDLAATAVTSASAHIVGRIDPRGFPGTFHVAYGVDAAQLSSATADHGFAGGTSPLGVGADLAGLQPNQTYFYRLVAATPDGGAQSNVASFVTAKAAPVAPTGGTANSAIPSIRTPDRLRIAKLRLKPRSLTPGKGTTIRFKLAGGPAVVRFTVERLRPPRTAGRRVVKLRGSFRTRAKNGANKRRWKGTLRGMRLTPGSYRLVAVARKRGATSVVVRVPLDVQGEARGDVGS